MTHQPLTRSLGEIARVSAGNSAPQDERLFEGGRYPFFRTSDVGKIRFGGIEKSTDCLNDEGIVGLRLFPRGTILFPKSGASTFLNHRVILNVDGYVSSHLATITADETKVTPRFLLYFLSTVATQDLVQDHAYPSLNLPLIQDISVPVLPLPEQRRIVAILDEAFAGIAAARANAERNRKNAREVFDGYLQSVFTRRLGWGQKRLEEACVIGDGNHSSNYPKKEELVAEGVPFIRATNLVAGGISDDDMRYLPPEKHAQLKKGHLKTGDVLFTNRGEIGRTAIVDANHDGSNLNSQIAWLRCGETLYNRFLYYVLNSGEMKAHLDVSKNGAALQQFTIRQIKELEVPIPPIADQKALVDGIDVLVKETKHLESLYTRKLAALDELKQSLLQQAFSGAL